MYKCRVCDRENQAFMSFGEMPIANGFLNPNDYTNEYFFEMEVMFCQNCGMFQLVEQPDPKLMFHEEYAFFSSLSKNMQIHFKEFAELVIDNYISNENDPFVVELGSNDGIMLQHFKEKGYKHLGIEPSENVADVARSKGIETISEFFNLELAKEIVSNYGHASVLMGANVMCHIPNINDVAAGVKELLTSNGVLIFEDPYLGDMVSKTAYDQIYDEHVFIFSAISIANTFERHGLELIDVLPQSTHGGSMRYVLSPIGAREVKPSVDRLIKSERNQGLHLSSTFEEFKRNCEINRDTLLKLLSNLKKRGKKVVGYAATSKSTTVLNFCQIGPDLIEYISDTTPLKQGKFTPGMHIPVKPHSQFDTDHPEYALLFAWNHAAEILDKESLFTAKGGKWIYFVPKVEIV